MLVPVERIAETLGGKRVLGRRVASLPDLMESVERGLPLAALDRVVGRLVPEGPAATELRHRIVPKTTLARRTDRLSQEESERLERLARLTALAEDVWEDEDSAREFLTNPQPQLDGERPVDLVRSELGVRRVEDLLWALEYSLPA